MSDAVWERAQSRVYSTSSCARLGHIQFKVLHRIYYTKARLARIYPDTDDQCDRCYTVKADMAHMFWTCPNLRDFWSSICRILNEASNTNVKPSAEMAIFGVLVNELLLPSYKKEAFTFASVIACRRILLDWKSPKPLQASLWLSDLMLFLKLEKNKILYQRVK